MDLTLVAKIEMVLEGAPRWAILEALGQKPKQLTFSSLKEAAAALDEARKIRNNNQQADAILRAMVQMTTTFKEAWRVYQMTPRDSITGARAFLRATKLATTKEELSMLFYNTDPGSSAGRIVIRHLARFLKNESVPT